MARGKQIDTETREQVRAYLASCGNIRETARKFEIAPSAVMKIRDEEKDEFEQLRTDKKQQFIEGAWELIGLGIKEMKIKMVDASFKDIATGVGIVTDKMLLMSGEPTSRSDNTNKNTHELGELTAEQADALIKAYTRGESA